ncbi:MAG: hypothetical protein ACRDDZ_04520 [Marinifilaceae bacterium]
MKKILYIGLLLFAVACGKDDAETLQPELSDLEKPYTTLSNDEVKKLIEEASAAVRAEFTVATDTISYNLEKYREVINHYEAPIYGLGGDRTTKSEPMGLKYTWNANTRNFDLTLCAGNQRVISMPSSIENGNVNDFSIINNYYNRNGFDNSMEWKKNDKIVYGSREFQETSDIMTGYTKQYNEDYALEFKVTHSKQNMNQTVLFTRRENQLFHLSMSIIDKSLQASIEFSNLRLRLTINNFTDLESLRDLLYNSGTGMDSEKVSELLGIIYNNNITESVIVFTDRDEKIGEFLYPDKPDVITVRLKDGELFEFVSPFFIK